MRQLKSSVFMPIFAMSLNTLFKETFLLKIGFCFAFSCRLRIEHFSVSPMALSVSDFPSLNISDKYENIKGS